MAATLDLAFDVGPAHVTTGMIAKRLGLSQPAIYKHYPRKEDIWCDVTDKLCDEIHANARTGRQAGDSPVTHLRKLVLGHLRIVRDMPALPEIMVSRDPTGSLGNTRRRIQDAMGDFRNVLVRYIEEARLAGHLTPELRSDDAVSLLIGIIQGLVLRLIVTRDVSPLLPEGARLLDLQLKLFENKGNAR